MKFTTYLVTAFNDGTPVPQAELDDILRTAWQRFGGYTLTGSQLGAWVDDAGTLYAEESRRLEIVCDRSKLSEAIDWVKQTGKRLGQKAMYLEIRDYDGVQLINV